MDYHQLCQTPLSGIAEWQDEDFDAFVLFVVQGEPEAFRTLLRADELPGFERWRDALGEPDASFDLLEHALALTLFHQTEEAQRRPSRH